MSMRVTLKDCQNYSIRWRNQQSNNNFILPREFRHQVSGLAAFLLERINLPRLHSAFYAVTTELLHQIVDDSPFGKYVVMTELLRRIVGDPEFCKHVEPTEPRHQIVDVPQFCEYVVPTVLLQRIVGNYVVMTELLHEFVDGSHLRTNLHKMVKPPYYHFLEHLHHQVVVLAERLYILCHTVHNNDGNIEDKPPTGTIERSKRNKARKWVELKRMFSNLPISSTMLERKTSSYRFVVTAAS